MHVHVLLALSTIHVCVWRERSTQDVRHSELKTLNLKIIEQPHGILVDADILGRSLTLSRARPEPDRTRSAIIFKAVFLTVKKVDKKQ